MTTDWIISDTLHQDYKEYELNKERMESICPHIPDNFPNEELKYISYIVDKCLKIKNDTLIINICLQCQNLNKEKVDEIIYSTLKEEEHE